jgi:hypothetical protein
MILTFGGILAIIHFIVFILGVGYAQNYYFHLREYTLLLRLKEGMRLMILQATTRTTLTRWMLHWDM